MSISLTWASYALIVSVCLVIYYPVVLFFYRKKLHSSSNRVSGNADDLSSFSSNQTTGTGSQNLNLFGEAVQNEELSPVMEEEPDFSPDAQDFADEIGAYTSSCGDGIEKEVVLQKVRKIILKYPSLAHSDAHYELSQLIAISTENYCSIHLSADELRELWEE